jgi:sulfur relay (sulfurtransferase) DsrC/TusE family protein
MDREHPARPFRKRMPLLQKHWTAQLLLRPSSQAPAYVATCGYKPAFHLVAHNQMDREHVARIYPQAQAYVATGHWTAQRLLRPCYKLRPMLQQANQMDREHVARLYPQAPAHVATGAAGAARSMGWRITNSPALKSKGEGQR